MDDLISVIVPVYNVARYLGKCLVSIIRQSYGNIEIILIDDGSSDDSWRICEEYSRADSRIRAFSQENRGVSAVRERGITEASGDYIAFVDSDDYIHPQMLEKLLLSLKSTGSDMSACGFEYVDEDGNSQKKVLPPSDEPVMSGERIIREQFAGKGRLFWAILCNKLIDRRLFEGFSFPDVYSGEDTFADLLMLKKCGSVSCVGECLYYYLQRGDSTTRSELKVGLARIFVYLGLADAFSGDGDYSAFCEQMLSEGLYWYKNYFWVCCPKDVLASEPFRGKKKEAEALFRSVWKKVRRTARISPGRFVYYEIHCISLRLAKCNYLFFHRKKDL
ncbi:MAG: glycosyltransferase [Clostridia bacterium]|nr:glycosyltransferase [Clostridia bacterium]